MNIYELTPRYDSRASFYGKAHIIEHPDGTKQLKSYETIVCEVSPRGVFKMLWDGRTQTTTRHIKEFRKQFERTPSDDLPDFTSPEAFFCEPD